MHATSLLGTEQCSNWRQKLAPDKSGLRFARHVAETGIRKMEWIYGAGFWSVCHGYDF